MQKLTVMAKQINNNKRQYALEMNDKKSHIETKKDA